MKLLDSENFKGNAMLEFVISLLFIIPLLIGLVDVSQMLVNFLKLEQVAIEGANKASKLPLLFESVGYHYTDADTLDTLLQCEKDDVRLKGGECEHAWVQARVRTILRYIALPGIPLGSVKSKQDGIAIESEFLQSRSPDVPDRIQLVLNVTYNGFLGRWPLSVRSEVPWSYSESVEQSGV